MDIYSINDEIVHGVLKRNLKDIKKLIVSLKKIYRAKG